MTEPKPYEIKVTSDPVTEKDRAQRWAPDLHVEIRSKGYGRHEVANHPAGHELEDPNHRIVGTFDAPADMIHEVICSCGWSGPDTEFRAHNKEK